MAVVSSHTLNGVDGTHAGGIKVELRRLGDVAPLFAATMGDGGRLSENVELTGADPDAMYEMVFHTAAYWAARGLPQGAGRIIPEVVLRFSMPDPDGRYHMPIILSPNGYSTWASG